MKNYIFNIIFATMFCSVPALANPTPQELVGSIAETPLATAESEIQAAMDELTRQLTMHVDAIYGVHRVYCKTDQAGVLDTGQCGADDGINQTEIASIIIDYYTGGWLPVTEVGRPNLAATADLVTAFDLADKERLGTNPNAEATTVFDDHLCLEVHFKDNDEMDYVLPFFANKTVVFCAHNTATGELNTLRSVGMEAPTDDANHLLIAGWTCMNPHEGFLNGGQAFGFDDDDNDSATVPVASYPSRSGLLQECIKGVSVNLGG
jgi:hypothetical protein